MSVISSTKPQLIFEELVGDGERAPRGGIGARDHALPLTGCARVSAAAALTG